MARWREKGPMNIPQRGFAHGPKCASIHPSIHYDFKSSFGANKDKLRDTLIKSCSTQQVPTKEAWQEKKNSTMASTLEFETKLDQVRGSKPNSTLAEKTKKNVFLEASLFSIVSLGFFAFNLFYWTRERTYQIVKGNKKQNIGPGPRRENYFVNKWQSIVSFLYWISLLDFSCSTFF